MLDNSVVLLTGGTGSLGHALTRRILTTSSPRKLIIFSRDEYKQSLMAKEFEEYANIRFFLGDVRDKERLRQVFKHVDYVLNCAALKQIPALEYNPVEAVRTNIDGVVNIVDAAIENQVKVVVGISTDKAVKSVNLYGATKMCGEKIFHAANAYSGNKTRFCCVRYGNVLGSRGSVIEVFKGINRQAAERGEPPTFPITDSAMTRFWITLDQAVDLVLYALENLPAGQILIPHLPSMRITDLAQTINQKCIFNTIGIRPGEKLHESLVAEGEKNVVMLQDGKMVAPPVPYTSDTNGWWLTQEELQKLL